MTRTTPTPHPALALAPEVAEALAAGRPVVALESTIISHGMPYPRNVEMAREVERIVRDGGATPATIAILDGVARIGLSADELELLATHEDVAKVSIRDLPHIMATKRHGATTVASTMRLAALAGIKVFVTGGLGGVHRGAENSMDVSADLTELSTTDVAVVSAGVKSILDIGRTLEVLETLGVPVVTFGVNEYPSFYSRESGFTSPMRSDSIEELADMMRIKWDLGLAGGISVTNPVPAEDEMTPAEISELIDQAVAEAEQRGIVGKDITPFLLGRIVELSDGKSLDTNIALVRNNARLGAALAKAYAAVAPVN
ncbi:pseudouridine-5'-phosphate glycosidase [Knoellia subterranea]|uniref:Pseudouridine-5'-phosphate glycosidase n=1 Tax=Knoellia subterranea KCTC 19937 TaxID=1385521 RepID=A0A0A0JLH2_9MICO|nr:pseudouridine-5'-phosphate glycosidase [Knoellia subterranea]KGN36466.1 pseudouridine-5'-phosphate glycosidase [Knoellia subterranea KCTC 19937]